MLPDKRWLAQHSDRENKSRCGVEGGVWRTETATGANSDQKDTRLRMCGRRKQIHEIKEYCQQSSNGEEKNVDRIANRRRASELRRTCVGGVD